MFGRKDKQKTKFKNITPEQHETINKIDSDLEGMRRLTEYNYSLHNALDKVISKGSKKLFLSIIDIWNSEGGPFYRRNTRSFERAIAESELISKGAIVIVKGANKSKYSLTKTTNWFNLEMGYELITHVDKLVASGNFAKVEPDLSILPRQNFNIKKSLVAKKGYVYLIMDTSNGTYKIGKTINPEDRFRQLGVLPAHERKSFALISCIDHDYAEKVLHRYFHEFRLRGEWFDLSSKQIALFGNSEFFKHLEIEVLI